MRCGLKMPLLFFDIYIIYHVIIIGLLINVQVQGQHPHQWSPFQIAGLLHAWQIYTRSLVMSVMRFDSQELPLSTIPLCQLLPCHFGPPSTSMSRAVLTAPLERSTYPYHRSLLSFRMRSRSSMPIRTSSSLDLVVTMS